MDEARMVVFFDGGCLLCSAMVKWTHHRDKEGEIWFAALDSDFAEEFRAELGLPEPGEQADTFVFWDRNDGCVAMKSAGALLLLKSLGGFWAGLGTLGAFVPAVVRDVIYDGVARNRRRWFGTSENCTLPPASLRGKVLE